LADFPQHLISLSSHKKCQFLVEKRKKSKNFQFANFGKYLILSPDLAMENDIV
jgi:hypothetical protein